MIVLQFLVCGAVELYNTVVRNVSNTFSKKQKSCTLNSQKSSTTVAVSTLLYGSNLLLKQN